MLIKIFSLLILSAFYMGIKQGWAILIGKPDTLEMFAKWNIGKQSVLALGLFTLLSAVLILFPKTFLWGNFLTTAAILLIMCLHLMDKDLKGVLIELYFFLLSLVIIYLQYPLTLNK